MTDFDEVIYEEEILRLRTLLAAERRKARTDALTGVGNRTAWEELQPEGHAVVLFLDAANLHYANTILGYDAADGLLRRIAECCRAETDAVYRLGGDEFAVVLPSGPTLDDKLSLGVSVGLRIQRAVGTTHLDSDHEFFVTYGIGTHLPGYPFSAAIADAQRSMQRNKDYEKRARRQAPSR